MKVKDLTITDELKEIVQIGIVVEDIEKAKQGMLDVFGLAPDNEGDFVYKECYYPGETIEAPVYAVFYDFFNVQLEFLQPVGDQDTIWKDYLKMGMHGLHHIRFDVDDQDAIIKLMADKGIGIWQEGTSLVNPACRFTYFDSMDKLGFIVEAVTRAR